MLLKFSCCVDKSTTKAIKFTEVATKKVKFSKHM